jgi:DNA-binding CsgD family transcriptional regulator
MDAPAADPDSPPVHLTSRQWDVVNLAARGLEDEEIGRVLFLSANTVKTHLRNAYARLGARGRAQAVALAFERNVLPSPAFEVLRAARPLLARIPACPYGHPGEFAASALECEFCQGWASAQSVLASADAVLEAARRG